MYFIRFFKVTGHLGKQFILSDTNIDSKTKLISNSVLDSVRQRYWIRIDPMGAAHIEIALIDAGFFYDRGIFSANIHELSGVLFIKLEIRSGHEKIRAFAKRHANGLTCFDTEFLSRDRFSQDNTGSLFAITANDCRDQTDIRLSVCNSPGSFPGQIRTIDINMKHEFCHGSHLLTLILLF